MITSHRVLLPMCLCVCFPPQGMRRISSNWVQQLLMLSGLWAPCWVSPARASVHQDPAQPAELQPLTAEKTNSQQRTAMFKNQRWTHLFHTLPYEVNRYTGLLKMPLVFLSLTTALQTTACRQSRKDRCKKTSTAVHLYLKCFLSCPGIQQAEERAAAAGEEEASGGEASAKVSW